MTNLNIDNQLFIKTTVQKKGKKRIAFCLSNFISRKELVF